MTDGSRTVAWLATRGIDAEALSTARARTLFQRWLETYATPVKAQTGKWVHLGYPWHAFSYEFVRALSGHAALGAYAELWDEPTPRRLFLLPESRAFALACDASAPVSFERTEWIVVADDFEWTMVFTHEDGLLGPYFSRAEWVDTSASARPSRRRRR